MNKQSQLVKNTGIIFLGKVSTQLLSFLLLPLYTSYLTTEDYGIADLIITYITLLVPMISIQLEMAAFRYLVDSRDEDEKIKAIISNVLCAIIGLVLLFIIFYYIVNRYIYLKYSSLIMINIIINIFSSLFLQFARGLGKNILYSIASCISGIITIVFNVLLIVICKYGASGMLVSMIIANSASMLFIYFKLKIYKYFSFKEVDNKLIKNLISYSIPLVPNGMSWWIVNVSDRTIIAYFIGVSANGIYATSNKFSALLIGVFNIFNISWTESASLHINEKGADEFFSNIINSTFKIFSCLCLIIISCMSFIFPIVINNQYNEAYLYIPILLLSTLLNIVVGLYSSIYIAKKMTKQVATTSILAAIINIVINIFFIKRLELYAASISTVIAYLVMSVYRHCDIKRYIEIKWDTHYLISYVVVFVFTVIIYYYNTFLCNILNILIAFIYSFAQNRNLIFKVCNKIKMI